MQAHLQHTLLCIIGTSNDGHRVIFGRLLNRPSLLFPLFPNGFALGFNIEI